MEKEGKAKKKRGILVGFCSLLTTLTQSERTFTSLPQMTFDLEEQSNHQALLRICLLLAKKIVLSHPKEEENF